MDKNGQSIKILIMKTKRIIIHATNSPAFSASQRPGASPFNFVILKNGNILKLKRKSDEYIKIAYDNALPENGNLKKPITSKQEENLFNLIVQLSEKYKDVKIKGAISTSIYKPDFDVKIWLKNYTPDLGFAA